MAAKKKINKADFIRKFPTAKASEIVAKGKAAGIWITSNYVYMVRSAKGGKARAPKRSAGGGGLQARVERLAREFASEVMKAVRSASVEELI